MDGADTSTGDEDGTDADVATVADGSIARFRSALADVVSPREAALAGAVAADLRGRARDVRELGSRPPGQILRALRRSVAGIVAAARPGRSSSRLAVALALLVVASVTLTLVGTLPAAAVFGDDEGTTYTVDAEEIRLAEGGQICAASVGSDTYRVTITDATLVDATVYQQQGDDAVKADFPQLSVDDTIVMYTESDDEDFELLATTKGCTDEDQTSRTVFRNYRQVGEQLRGPQGVTMLNMQTTDGTVPEPGGFRFAAPDENGSSSPTNVSGGVEQVADDVDDVLNGSLVDRLENGTDGGLGVNETVGGVDEAVGNATDGPAGADAVEDATGNATNATGEAVSTVGETVENTTREVAGDDPPENVSGTVDGTTDAVDTTTGEVESTTDDVTDATDEVANSTGDETTSTVVDDTTDVVDGTTETVTNTTDTVTDGVDDTTDQVVRPVEETATPESTETSEPTPSPTEVPITPTDVLTPTATPEDETPAWLDQVDDDERTSVLETIEETDGGFESVENVTEETDGYSEETIDGDENLTRLDNGTVLLLNGTDADQIDWGTVEDTLDTDLTSTDDSETEATTSETDDGSGSDDGTLFG